MAGTVVDGRTLSVLMTGAEQMQLLAHIRQYLVQAKINCTGN